MHRVNSGTFQNIVPSAQKPPKAPTKTTSPQMDTAGCKDGGRDYEKGEKRRLRLRADQAIHLVPVVLLACLFVLYIYSSLPTEDQAVGLDQIVSTALSHRRLQTADEGNDPSTLTRTEVRVTEHDLHRLPFRLRGGRLHP